MENKPHQVRQSNLSLISRLRFRPPGKPPTKNPSKTLSASISESISESINAIASVAGLISVILAFEHLPETTAIAQVTPDQSLPSPSQVETAADLLTITGGTELGGNLFHSFQEFSVRAGETAFFDHNAAIANIISRVTGTNRSNIDGQIRTNGSANLFLLNPNGILFGNNASLDIGGSFIASTAEGVVFADGSLFSANNAAIPASLLTMTAPMGLQFGNNPGSIVSSSQLPIRSELRLQPNRTLALVGGDLAIAGSVLTAPIGRIELGSVTTAGVVNLNQIEQGWQLDYGEINSTGFGNINLSDRAFVTTDGNGGGNIQVQASNLTLLAGSTISANTQGDLPGGNLLIRATDAIELVGESPDGQFITLFTSSVLPGASGNGGNINVISDRLILRDGAQILSGTFGIGNAGNTNIQARQIELSGIRNDGSTVSGLFATAEPESIGQGGNLTIAADQFVVKDGAQVVVTTFSSGRAGDLTVRAEAIELAGGNPLSPVDVSGFKASADVNSTGDGGNLSIETNRIVIKDGAEAQVSTLGTGNAGNLLLTATESVELVGTSADGLFPSALRAVSGLEGNFTEATGEGGDLTVITDRLEIRDRANIAVSAIGPTGGAGNLTILANRIFLDNQAGLEAETRAGDRGNINLTLGDTLQLLGNSSISTNAIGTATGGNIAISSQTLAALENSDITANSVSNFGGLVSISAQGVFGTTERDSLTPASDITASSELGAQFSGVVEINTPDVDPAQGLLTLPTSFAAENQLVTSACAIDRNLSSAKLLITGRGGLPIAPTVARSGIDIIDDLGDSWPEPPQLSMRSSQTQPELHLNKSADSLDRQALNISSFPQLKSNPDASLPTTLTPPSAIGSQPQLLTGRQVQNKADISSSNSDTAIIEAQGWLHNAHDQVVLVSQLPDLSQNHGSEIGSEPQATTSAKINRINYTDRLAMQSRSRAFGDRHHCYPAASVR